MISPEFVEQGAVVKGSIVGKSETVNIVHLYRSSSEMFLLFSYYISSYRMQVERVLTLSSHQKKTEKITYIWMLGHRLRRCTSIETTHIKRVICIGILAIRNVYPTLNQDWVNVSYL